MRTLELKRIILLLLIAFICRFVQDLFNPYVSCVSYMNWELWLLNVCDAVMLTIELIIGWFCYRSFKERRRKLVKIMAIIISFFSILFTLIQKKALLLESVSGIISIVICAVWRISLLIAGIVIVIWIVGIIYDKFTDRKSR